MAMDWLQHRARAARLLRKGWQKFARAFSLQALRRAWDRWGFYASLALVLALIGGGAAAIRNRPAPEIAPGCGHAARSGIAGAHGERRARASHAMAAGRRNSRGPIRRKAPFISPLWARSRPMWA